MIRRPFALAALLLLVASPLQAQLTEKQAVAQFKAGAKQHLKLLKASAKLARAQFQLDLQETEQDYAGGGLTWQAALGDVFNLLAALQVDLRSQSIDTIFDALDGPGAAALAELGVGGDAFPPDFYFGKGGVLDDFVADVHGVLDKELAAVSKRLQKTAKLLDKQEDVLALFRVVRPDFNDHWALNEGGAVIFAGDELSLHTFVSGSVRGTAGDGLLCVAGQGWAGAVVLSFAGGSEFNLDAEVGAGSQWKSISPDMVEGNYAVAVNHPGDLAFAVANFGVP